MTSNIHWLRGCAECGTVDIHSIFPIAAMVEDPYWRCGECYCGSPVAVAVDLVGVLEGDTAVAR
ncbi:MAG: hypothetical protein RIB98_14060 [Acidimicrobiales bacterium]